MINNSILALLIAILYSCGTIDTVNVGANEKIPAETVEEVEKPIEETEPEATDQPQWSSDKLYNGMSKEEVLDLLGTPLLVESKYLWRYDESFDFCLGVEKCFVKFNLKGTLWVFGDIDAEYIHILSF